MNWKSSSYRTNDIIFWDMSQSERTFSKTTAACETKRKRRRRKSLVKARCGVNEFGQRLEQSLKLLLCFSLTPQRAAHVCHVKPLPAHSPVHSKHTLHPLEGPCGYRFRIQTVVICKMCQKTEVWEVRLGLLEEH